MPTPGRPKSLAEGQLSTVCYLVENGASIRQAARSVGCDPSSIRREAERNDEFRCQLAKAKAEAKLQPLDLLRHAADTDWRAAISYLKYLDPDRFSRSNASTVTQREANQFVGDLIESIERAVSKPQERADLFELLATTMPAAMRRRWDGTTLRCNRKQVLSDFDKRRAADREQRAKQRREFALQITKYLPRELILKLHENIELNEIFERPPTSAGTAALRNQAQAEPHPDTPANNSLTNDTLANGGPREDEFTNADPTNDDATNFAPLEVNNASPLGRNPSLANPQRPNDLPPQREAKTE